MSKWIASAIRHPGALTRQAKMAGMSVTQFCSQKHEGTTARRCNLAKTLRGFHKGGKR